MIYYGRDSSFFSVEVPSYSSGFELIQKDVQSMSLTEELNKLPCYGSVTMIDPSMTYARILRNNVEMAISWGYKDRTVALEQLSGTDLADSFSKPLARRAVSVRVLNPGGGGDDRGLITYRCGFASIGWRGDKAFSKFESGTKLSVLVALFSKMGIENVDIRFDGQNASYSDAYAERQYETPFQCVARLAREWGCIFGIGANAQGIPSAFFLSAGNLSLSPMAASIGGGSSSYVQLDYLTGARPNVLHYDWQNQEGENGAGDNSKVIYNPDGSIIIQRFTIENDKVVTWTLNMDAIKDEFNRREKDDTLGGMKSQADFVQSIVNTTDFTSVRDKYFTKQEQTTAPNGFGYTITGRMLGDPTVTAGMVAVLGDGFPDCLRKGSITPAFSKFNDLVTASSRSITYFFRKVTHSIDASGYFTDFEIVDAGTLFGPSGIS